MINSLIENVNFAVLAETKTEDLTEIDDLIRFVGCDESANSEDILPDLDPFDYGYNFDIKLSSQSDTKLQYSEMLKTLFVSPDKNFYFDVTYTPKESSLILNLKLRAITVFKDDVSVPVKRCATHCSKDRDCQDEAKLCNNIRVDNAIYSGVPDGKFLRDRLAICIPLPDVIANSDNIIKQKIALKLLCPNSCIGRKPTAIIFTLETAMNSVLAKTIYNVQVSQSPKRDKCNKEQATLNKERAMVESECPVSVKRIKTEFFESSMVRPLTNVASESLTNTISTQPSSSSYTICDNSIVLSVRVPNLKFASSFIDDASNRLAGWMFKNNTTCYRKEYNDLQRLRQEIEYEKTKEKQY